MAIRNQIIMFMYMCFSEYGFSLQTLFKLLGVRDFLPNDQILKFLATTVCKDKWTQALCSNVVFLFSGYDPKQLNMVCIIQCTILYCIMYPIVFALLPVTHSVLTFMTFALFLC